MNKAVAAIVLICFSMVGCASSSKNVGTTYISPMQYNHYECNQLSMEYTRLKSRVSELSAKQDSAATRDAVAMGVGMLVFWPALFFLAGSKGSPEELARIKGECEAIEVTSIQKNCTGLSTQMAEERKQGEVLAKKAEAESAVSSPSFDGAGR
jgi:hypothetical protein